MDVQPVDGDPFTGASLQPVNGDPFTAGAVTPTSQGQAGSFLDKLGTTWPARMAVGAYDAMMAPGDYMQGLISTEEAERQAFNAAGLVMSGGVLSGVERAAGEAILGSGPVLRVARRMPDGTVKVGQPGQIHSDLIAEGDPKLAGPDQVETTMGYVTPSGKYLDRNEALQYAKQNEPGRAAASLEQPQYGLEAATYNEPHLEPVSGDPFQPITAYHGSPHDFDQFDISKIGTGEGVQAYGHGLYFADNPAVAGDYRNKLAQKLTDLNRTQVANDAASALGSSSKYIPWAVLKEVEAGTPIDSVASKLSMDPTIRGRLPSEIYAAVDYVKQNYPDHAVVPGKMYQVQINANPDHFLDWDKPLSEQHPVVQQGLEKVIGPLDADPRLLSKDGGQAHWIASVNRNGDSAAASQALQQAGIPGIKYLDAGSRSAGDGTRNYVVFNHDIIDIIKKYGIGGLGIGTAAGIKHFQTQPVNNDPYSNQNPGGVI